MPLPAWCLTLSYGIPPPHRAIRILFLCTNLPFFGCGVALAARGHPYLGLATALMGFVSGAFHFYQCLDGLNSQRVRYLLVADQACAAVLVAANVGTASEWPSPLVWALGTVALLLLWWGTLRPNRGGPTAAPWSAAQQSLYAWTHGAWHLLICASSSLFVAQAPGARAARRHCRRQHPGQGGALRGCGRLCYGDRAVCPQGLRVWSLRWRRCREQ